MTDQELAHCAKINFENLEKAMPVLLKHPYYLVAKGQLNEAVGDGTFEDFIKKHGMNRCVAEIKFDADGKATVHDPQGMLQK